MIVTRFSRSSDFTCSLPQIEGRLQACEQGQEDLLEIVHELGNKLNTLWLERHLRDLKEKPR